MSALFGGCPAVTHVLVTWVFTVVPIGVPLIGPDMSLDMRLVVVFVETTGSD
jgi:hypothetical protein